jgi:hypothetical protein
MKYCIRCGLEVAIYQGQQTTTAGGFCSCIAQQVYSPSMTITDAEIINRLINIESKIDLLLELIEK